MPCTHGEPALSHLPASISALSTFILQTHFPSLLLLLTPNNSSSHLIYATSRWLLTISTQ